MTTGRNASTPLRGRIDKRAAILDAALRVFVQEGYGLARVETIAERAGVAKPTVYNHFRDKENLFRTVILDGAQRTGDRIVAALDLLPDDGADLAGALTRVARNVIDCQLNDEGWALQRLMYAEAARFPDLFDDALRLGGAHVHIALAGRLARLAHRGHLDIDDADLAAGHFLALVSGDLPTLSALGTRAVTDHDLQAAIAAGVNTFLRAFNATPPDPNRRPAPTTRASTSR
ncbi:transcriptional regulator, TetR family [Frankia torreyi]|uniref:Transcriptional regulator, TetR family n=1 Tax=Frankia torreyi TaxID=1856 RepID=A0A0D8BDN8_9ACTN|nr:MULTISPECIES: TetR/AcrR family transcriptional regulator [Frankia]KJE22373.1 transcriptional regulator, TetR family [Frankia torreyi]KQC37387.1 TetR family transcriptional regulator [Frankia sp. ACN1ag]KQM04977.1 transcriptional regulator, TetR family [Frankia sp. CpI1-P]